MKLGLSMVSKEIVKHHEFRSIPSIVSKLEPSKMSFFGWFFVHPSLLNQP